MVRLAGGIKNRAFALNQSEEDDFEMPQKKYLVNLTDLKRAANTLKTLHLFQNSDDTNLIVTFLMQENVTELHLTSADLEKP